MLKITKNQIFYEFFYLTDALIIVYESPFTLMDKLLSIILFFVFLIKFLNKIFNLNNIFSKMDSKTPVQLTKPKCIYYISIFKNYSC